MTSKWVAPDEAAEDVTTDAGPHLPAVPGYPVQALTGPLRELTDAGVAAGLPAPLVAGAGLGALAAVCGMADLDVYDTWTARSSLWLPLIAPAGGGKTPSVSLARRRLRQLDADGHHQFRRELAEYQATPAKDRDEATKPADPTRLIGDITTEMVARWLASGDGTGAVDSDELAGWLRSLYRYRGPGGTDAARWLALWSSQPWRYQRVGSDIDLLVARPVLTVCGGIQPHLLNLLGLEGDGMRPRWLPHLSMTTDLNPGPGQPTPAWDEAIDRLYTGRQHRQWTLTGRELATWRDAQRRWKAAQRGAESPSVTAALAKADEQAARITLVLAEALHPVSGGPVPAEAVTAAVTIIDYTLNVWRALPGGETLSLSRRAWVLNQAVDKLADWLERHGGCATRREIQAGRVAGARTAPQLNALLLEYEQTYPGSVHYETPEDRAGKRGYAGQVVHAPRREHGQSPDRARTSHPANADGNTYIHGNRKNLTHVSAGQVVSMGTVDTVDTFPVDSFASTVPATTSHGQAPDSLLQDQANTGDRGD